VPTIGDNVFIGPGAKLFGEINIGDNVMIGANAVVTKSFEEGCCRIAGIPAKKISDEGNFYHRV
jgi:serine O-acetyltransferase